MCSDFAASAPAIIPDAFDTELLLSCMQNLKHGKAVDIPNYIFKTYKSVPNAKKVLLYMWYFS
jgi:uridine kinase